jgi:hypothetical protein
MLSSQEERREREEVMRQDADLRKRQEEAERRAKEQSGTFFSHTHADEISGGGRFAGTNPATVVGQDPQIKYPQLPASSPWSGTQPEPGLEPPLGFDNLAPLEPSIVNRSVEGTGGAEALSFSMDVEHAAPPFSPVGDGPVKLAGGERLQPSASQIAGSSPSANRDDDNGTT